MKSKIDPFVHVIVCIRCKVPQDSGQFNKNKASKSGLDSWCKSCKAKYMAEPKMKVMKQGYAKKSSERIFEVYGNKCASCGEKYNSNSNRRNLQLHHRFYSEEDTQYFKKHGIGQGKYEALRMLEANQINELKNKFTLLCPQCNMLEAYVRKDGKKAFEAFCWLYSEGHFDEALKDDTSFKKLSEFMK